MVLGFSHCGQDCNSVSGMTKTNVEKIFNLVVVMSAYCFKNMLLADIHQVMGESVHPNGGCHHWWMWFIIWFYEPYDAEAFSLKRLFVA